MRAGAVKKPQCYPLSYETQFDWSWTF